MSCKYRVNGFDAAESKGIRDRAESRGCRCFRRIAKTLR